MFDIQYGERFKWNGSSWAFDHAENGGDPLWFVRDDGKMDSISRLNLMIGFSRATHGYDGSYKGGRHAKTENLLLSIRSFSEEHLAEAWARRHYAVAIIAAGRPKKAAKTWHAIIHGLDVPEPFTRHPSWHTVKKWVALYDAGEGDIRALIPNFRKRGRNSFFSALTPAQRDLIGNVMDGYKENFLPTIKTIHKALEVKHEEARRTLPYALGWKTPSLATVRRWIESADRLTLLERRYTKEEAKRQLKLQLPGYEAFDRLDMVEIDHTEVDIMVVDKRGANLGRPTLTIAIDAYTRMIVGHYIGFEPPSAYSVMMCLRDMLLPKTYLQTKYGLKVHWNAFGRPLVVLVDNAAEFKGNDFKQVSGLLNINIRIQPVGKPWFKGRVESFMNKIRLSRAVRAPGATIDIDHRRKTGYDPENEARIELDEFRVAFLEWMLLEHAYEFHEEILDTPAKRWADAVALRPVRLCDPDEIDTILGHHDSATLTNKGLLYENLYYQCQELQDLLFSRGKHVLSFVSNPGNMGSIMVTLPGGNAVRAYCTESGYASEVTLWQHQRIRAEARRKSEEWVKGQDLHTAYLDMIKRSEEFIRRGKNVKAAARNLGIDYVSQPGHEASKSSISPVTHLNWTVKNGNVNEPEPINDTSEKLVGEPEEDVPMPNVRDLSMKEIRR